MIIPDGISVTFTTKHSGNVLTTTLTITNAIKSYTGYYWVRLPSGDVCNVSVTTGRSTWKRFLTYVQNIAMYHIHH